MEEQQVTQGETTQPLFQEALPNAGTALTLGILSMLFCCCGPISLPMGIIAWVMGNKGKAKYQENPNAYTPSSFSNMNAGRVCGVVGVVLSVLFLIYMVVSMWYGIQEMGGWDAYWEKIQEAAEQYN